LPMKPKFRPSGLRGSSDCASWRPLPLRNLRRREGRGRITVSRCTACHALNAANAVPFGQSPNHRSPAFHCSICLPYHVFLLTGLIVPRYLYSRQHICSTIFMKAHRNLGRPRATKGRGEIADIASKGHKR
jgi:hypothetical protein